MANVKKGSSQPNSSNVGVITLEQLKEIALIKLTDLNTNDIEKAIEIVKGTAKNMGIRITPS
jgi:large subunit ribosomal protein L11